MRLGRKLASLVVVFLMVFGSFPVTGALAAGGYDYTYKGPNGNGTMVYGYYEKFLGAPLYNGWATSTGEMDKGGTRYKVYSDDIGYLLNIISTGGTYKKDPLSDGHVRAVLAAGSYGYSGSTVVAAKQAAIWHFTNNFVLEDYLWNHNSNNVKTLYNTYIGLPSAGSYSDTPVASLTVQFKRLVSYSVDFSKADIEFKVHSSADLDSPSFSANSGTVTALQGLSAGDNTVTIKGVNTSGTFTLGVSVSQTISHDACTYDPHSGVTGRFDGVPYTTTATVTESGSIGFGGFKIRKDFSGSSDASEYFQMNIDGGSVHRTVQVRGSDGWVPVSGLPFGTYDISETLTDAQKAKYQYVSIDNPSVNINNTNGDNGDVRVTNRKIAKMTVHMDVTDGQGSTQKFPVTVSGPSGTFSFFLADDESYPIDSLILGDYTATEGTIPFGYSFVSINGNTAAQTVTVSVNDTGNYDVNIVNRKMFGSLVVTKDISGGDAKDGDVFIFDLYQGTELKDTQTITAPAETCTFPRLEFADYTVKERGTTGYGTPDDYVSGVSVKIESETPKGITCINRKLFGSIVVTKDVTDGDADTGDVFTFDLYQGTELKDTQTITAPDTTCTFAHLEFGDYIVKERGTAGYGTPDDYVSGVPVKIESETPKGITCSNAKLHGSIVVTKDVYDGDAEKGEVFTFDLYRGAELVDTQTITAPATVCTFPNLVFGDYRVVERDVDGYDIPDDFAAGVPVKINSTTAVDLPCTNSKLHGSITILKTVSGGDMRDDEVFTFDLYRGTELVDTQTIKASKMNCTFSHLVFGDYTVKERYATGYVRQDEYIAGVAIKIDNTGVNYLSCENKKIFGSITVNKTFAGITAGTLADGFVSTFDIYAGGAASGDPIATLTCAVGTSSQVVFEKLEYGLTYTVKERAVDGYQANDDFRLGFAVTIADGASAPTYTCTNTQLHGSATFTKTVENVPGDTTMFTVDIVGDNGYTNSVTIGGITTAQLSDLPFGKYTLTERNDSAYRLIGFSPELLDIGAGSYATDIPVIVTNHKLLGQIEFVKRDVSDPDLDHGLKGAEFQVSTADGDDFAANIIATVYTDKDGKATTDYLPEGYYYVRASAPPTGYVIDNDEIAKVNVTDGETNLLTPYTDTKDEGGILVAKASKAGGVVEGATFELLDKDPESGGFTDSNIIDTKVTDDKGKVLFDGLPTGGSYWVRETVAAPGYNIDSTAAQGVTIKFNTNLVLDFTDTPYGQVQVTQTDVADTAKRIGGAVYGVYSDSDCTVLVDTLPATDSVTGAATGVKLLPFVTGTIYYVQQITPATGYLPDTSKQEASFTSAGQVLPLTFAGTRDIGSIILKMVDALNPTVPLVGAGFELYFDKDCKLLAAPEQTTGGDGTLRFDGLEPGIYYLKQTKAPTDYTMLTDPVDVVLDPGGTETVTLQNEYHPPKGYQTGMMDWNMLIIGGLMLVAGLLVVLFLRKRRVSKNAG
jgi:LPXTG-motif cell wall-anchored protein